MRILAVIIILAIIIPGCIQYQKGGEPDFREFRVFADSDRGSYSSRENIEISLRVESPGEVENAFVMITGIQPYSYAYINIRDNINLSRGVNELTFNATTPSCTSGCGGVKPGSYEINVSLSNGSAEICNTTFLINLTA